MALHSLGRDRPSIQRGRLRCSYRSADRRVRVPCGKGRRLDSTARAIWGWSPGIWTTIRSGAAAAEIGEDAVKVLERILGVGGVVSACSL
ncbi:hypothetical protein ACTXOR_06380 [Arthrobacter rhombi]|uniref:hypothetical protein n=1 Tax=Arthrobacter rhombi TaxID=71253 RepID=UPI003FD5CA2F